MFYDKNDRSTLVHSAISLGRQGRRQPSVLLGQPIVLLLVLRLSNRMSWKCIAKERLTTRANTHISWGQRSYRRIRPRSQTTELTEKQKE